MCYYSLCITLSFASVCLAVLGMLCRCNALVKVSQYNFTNVDMAKKGLFNSNIFLSFEEAGICRVPSDPPQSVQRIDC